MSIYKKRKNKAKESFILINRYNPKYFVSITLNYKPIIEKQINYVEELPPFVYNRLNKRGRSSFSNRHIKYENNFEDYKDFAIKPSILY